MSILPDKSTTLDIMLVTKLLSQRSEKVLGEWEFQFQYDPPARNAEEEYVHILLCSKLYINYDIMKVLHIGNGKNVLVISNIKRTVLFMYAVQYQGCSY